MKTLPDNAIRYSRTPLFTQDSIPGNLRRSHTTKSGSWAQIRVVSGKLRYRILGDMPEEYILGPETLGVVEPDSPHEIEALGEVQFYVEFYKQPDN